MVHVESNPFKIVFAANLPRTLRRPIAVGPSSTPSDRARFCRSRGSAITSEGEQTRCVVAHDRSLCHFDMPPHHEVSVSSAYTRMQTDNGLPRLHLSSVGAETVGGRVHPRGMPRHSQQELAEFFAASDEGQVFARDIRAAPDSPLVYMAPHEVERFRADARAGRYVCPLPPCAGVLSAVGPDQRRHHWRHKPGEGGHGPESVWHFAAKAALAAWAREQRADAHVSVDDASTPAGARPDVWVRWSELPRGIAFEVQYAPLDVAKFRARSARYRDDVIHDVWLFGHSMPHTRPIADDGLGLTAVLRAVAGAGHPLLWINPETRAIITAFVNDSETLTPLPGELWTNTPVLSGPRLPIESDRAVLVGIDALDACVLDDSGIRTPTLEWVMQQVAARAAEEERLRATARAAYAAARDERERLRAEAERLAAAARAVEPASAPPRPVVWTQPPVKATPPNLAVQPECRHCGGVVARTQQWPAWYRPPTTVSEVWLCEGCGDVLGSVLPAVDVVQLTFH